MGVRRTTVHVSRSRYRPRGSRRRWRADLTFMVPALARAHVALDLEQGLAEWRDDRGQATCEVRAYIDMRWRHHKGRRRSRRERTQTRMEAAFARDAAFVRSQLGAWFVEARERLLRDLVAAVWKS
jgi:hypothetical protein